MTIETHQDLLGIQRVGKLVAQTLREMRQAARVGMTTAELDGMAGEFLTKYGGRSAPQMLLQFPGFTCISVNEEAVHGIPSDRVLQAGDMVTLDVTAELDGYIADAAETIILPPVDRAKRKLRDCAKIAFERAIKVARAGQPINVIGHAIEREVKKQGFSVMVELNSHGVGRAIHEFPSIPNFYNPRANTRLREGMVITIEPIIAVGTRWSVDRGDGWTVASSDGSLTAHHEHTLMITRQMPILLTALN